MILVTAHLGQPAPDLALRPSHHIIDHIRDLLDQLLIRLLANETPPHQLPHPRPVPLRPLATNGVPAASSSHVAEPAVDVRHGHVGVDLELLADEHGREGKEDVVVDPGAEWVVRIKRALINLMVRRYWNRAEKSVETEHCLLDAPNSQA
jgi:hypothetical protein